MVDQEEMIQQEIIRQMNLLKRIRQSQQVLQDAKDSVGKFRIEERPGIYRMNTQKNYTLFKKKEQLDLISEWTEKESFVFSCAVFYQKNIENGESEFDFGMGLREEYAQFLHVKESDWCSIIRLVPAFIPVFPHVPENICHWRVYRKVSGI